MKKLFVYYSMTGNGDLVSETFKEKGYDIRKVINKTKYSKKMFPLMMKGGYRALFRKKDKVEFNNDISNYKEIVIGSPIWFDRLSPALNSILSKLDLKDKNINFVLYSGSGEGNKAKEEINKRYNTNIIILKEPKKYKEELSKIGE